MDMDNHPGQRVKKWWPDDNLSLLSYSGPYRYSLRVSNFISKLTDFEVQKQLFSEFSRFGCLRVFVNGVGYHRHGHILFNHKDNAMRALKEMHNSYFLGQNLHVTWAQKMLYGNPDIQADLHPSHSAHGASIPLHWDRSTNVKHPNSSNYNQIHFPPSSRADLYSFKSSGWKDEVKISESQEYPSYAPHMDSVMSEVVPQFKDCFNREQRNAAEIGISPSHIREGHHDYLNSFAQTDGMGRGKMYGEKVHSVHGFANDYNKECEDCSNFDDVVHEGGRRHSADWDRHYRSERRGSIGQGYGSIDYHDLPALHNMHT